MWFKQLKIFQYQATAPLEAGSLAEAMQLKSLKECPKSQYSTIGWVSPFGQGSDTLLHATGRFWLMHFGKQERLLPPAVIKEKLEERIEQIRQEQDRPVYGQEKLLLKEQIESQLLPQAFTKNQFTYLYLDPQEQLLYIGSTHFLTCQKIIELLNTTIGGFKATPLSVDRDVSEVMTRWLVDNRWPKGFVIERDCEMFDVQREKNKVRFLEQNLAEHEVTQHLLQGKRLAKLSLSWQDKLAFTIDIQLNITRIRFLDMMQEQRDQQFCDSKAQQLDVDFTLMALEFSAWIPELRALFSEEPFPPRYQVKPQLETVT